MVRKSLVLCIFIRSSISFGGWDSGGGYILTTQNNPWFLSNTTQVKWCVDVDEDHFGIGVDTSISVIKYALNYWQNTFGKIQPVQQPNIDTRLATQKWHYQDSCEGGVDVTFLLGTTGRYQSYIPAPHHTIGLAQRTNYNRQLLRSQGFIYISPEHGPLKLAADGLRKDRWIWQDNLLLKLVLTHELGHIFGVDHDESFGLMAENFPASIIRAEFDELQHLKAIPDYFTSDPLAIDLITPYWHSGRTPKRNASSILRFSPNAKFLRIHGDLKSGISVFISETDSASWTRIGSIQARSTSGYQFGQLIQDISIYLPREQEIYPVDRGLYKFYMRFSYKTNAVFLPENGTYEIPVLIDWDQENFRLTSYSQRNGFTIGFLSFSIWQSAMTPVESE